MSPSLTTSSLKPAVRARLNPTKQKSLEILAEFFCLRTNEIASLLRNRSITESDARSVRRTLSILHRDRFLERLSYVDLAQERGGMTGVWGLSDKGVSHAFQNGYSTAATKSLDDHSRRTLDHELEISVFHMALRSFCNQNDLLYTWRQTDLKHTVHPDALFTIQDRAHPGREYCYFLEIERSKFGNYVNGEPQILRKLGMYYDQFDSNRCESEWGFRQFRVIVVQTTDSRRNGLIRALQERYRHRMFWLTTELDYRGNMGGEIFKTPKDYAERAQSFLTV